MNERGVVLIQTFMLIIFIGSMASLMLQRSAVVTRDTLRCRGELQALHAAEGGLALARHRLRRDPTWNGEQLQIGRCNVTVTVEREGGQTVVTARGASHPAGVNGPAVQVTLIEGLVGDYRYPVRSRPGR